MAGKTEVREPYFRIDLPSGWTGGPTQVPTLWQYGSADMSECLSVSIHVATTPIPGDERAKMLDDFIATRIRAETDQAGSRDLQMSEPAKQQQGMAWVASYNGFHPESQRRFSSFTIVNGTLIANFYYEALDCSAESFEERRKNLLGSVGVAD